MASNAKRKDWGQFWQERFPHEEQICEEINHQPTRRRGVDVAFSYIDPELDRPTRKVLTRYGLLAQPEDVEDYKQKGWERFINKANETGIPWKGPSTLFRTVYSCIKSAARHTVRREELSSSGTALTIQAQAGTVFAKPRANRVKIIRMPVENENTSEWDVNHFLFNLDSIADVEALLESKEKLQVLTTLVCDALRCVHGKFAQNMCILWFFMQMSPAEIENAWGASINQGRLREAKVSFVEHCLRLLAEAQATCATTVGLDFIMALTQVFHHFRIGDPSNGDINQHHPMALYLHSLVPSDYTHTPRAADAVETFINCLQSSQAHDW